MKSRNQLILSIMCALFVSSISNASVLLNAGGESAFDHLVELEKIALENDGHRAAGSLGHIMSANYIAQKLLAVGYKVELIPFEFTKYDQMRDATLKVNETSLKDKEEFNVMTFSPSGSLAQAEVVAIDLELGEGNTSTSGCEKEDFTEAVSGKVALIQRGSCSFQQKAQNAQKAGAVAAMIFNQGNEETRKELFGGTLSGDAEISIPVLSLPYALGVELSEKTDVKIEIAAETKVETKTTYNVVAETPGGRTDNVVMLGSHLDSVPEGPGLNDNGSGSAGILDVALRIMPVLDASSQKYNKLRFSWWSAEEVGLIGSSRYVDSLSADQKANIALYLNFDMIASPNYMLGVFDGDGSSHGQTGPEGSDAIERLFEMHFGLSGDKSVAVEMSGRSDYAPFAEVGIPVGGLFTGAEGTKSESEAKLFGGTAGEAYDKCYHKECDGLENINKDALAANVDAISFAALTYAYSTSEVNGNKFERSLSREKMDNQIHFDRTGNVHCGDEHLLE